MKSPMNSTLTIVKHAAFAFGLAVLATGCGVSAGANKIKGATPKGPVTPTEENEKIWGDWYADTTANFSGEVKNCVSHVKIAEASKTSMRIEKLDFDCGADNNITLDDTINLEIKAGTQAGVLADDLFLDGKKVGWINHNDEGFSFTATKDGATVTFSGQVRGSKLGGDYNVSANGWSVISASDITYDRTVRTLR